MIFGIIVNFLLFFGCEGRSISPSNMILTATPKPSPTPVSIKTQIKTKTREQTGFGMEDEIKYPVPLPNDVLKILREDEYVRARSLKEGESVENITASLFVASEIDLNEDNLPDLVVTGSEDSNLSGANVTVYWLFRNTPEGHRCVAELNTFGFDILKTKTNGFRDIEASAQTLEKVFTDFYVFDGKKYRLKMSRRKPIS